MLLTVRLSLHSLLSMFSNVANLPYIIEHYGAFNPGGFVHWYVSNVSGQPQPKVNSI